MPGEDPEATTLDREVGTLRARVRELEEALARSERGSKRYQLLLDNLTVGVFVSSHALTRTRSLLDEGKPLSAVLLDLTVRSGEGGRDVVGPLRELLPRVPILASSGYSDDPIMASPKQFGFTASLSKPFLLSDLSTLLAELIAESK